MLPWRWASHTFSNWSWSWLRERKEGKKKNRSSSPIGWWITPEHQTAARRTTACVQPIPVLASTDTRAWKTIGQGKFGSLFSPPMMHWGRLGWVWRCSKSSSSQLCSRADVTAGGKGKKKNRSNYSSNYLIISLCGGEQEGGWRRALCFLSPSALPSWWASVYLSALPVQISLRLASSSLFIIWPPTQTREPTREKRRRCRRLKVLTRNKLKTIKRERWESLCFRPNEWGHGGWGDGDGGGGGGGAGR